MLKRASWDGLLTTLQGISLLPEADTVSWSLSSSGKFKVQLLYNKLTEGPTLDIARGLWKASIPLKIKVFLWQLFHNRLPTSVNMAKRQGPSTGTARSVTWSRTQTTSSSDARWPGSLGAWFGPRTGCLGTRGPPAILWQSLTRSRGVVNVCCGAVFGHCSGRFG